VSRRSRRDREGRGERTEPEAASDAGTAPGRGPYRIRPAAQVAILVAVVAVVTLIAELAGAANLGTALSIAQIFFAVALIVVLVKS
jgi:hypothetical protein